jgi:hypothetical protein
MKKILLILLFIPLVISSYAQNNYVQYKLGLWFERNTSYVAPLKLEGFSVVISNDTIKLPDGINTNSFMYYIKSYPGYMPQKIKIKGKLYRYMSGDNNPKETYSANYDTIMYYGNPYKSFFSGGACDFRVDYYPWGLTAPVLDKSYTAYQCINDYINIKYTDLAPNMYYSIFVGTKKANGTYNWGTSHIKYIYNENSSPISGSFSIAYSNLGPADSLKNWIGKELYFAAKGGNELSTYNYYQYYYEKDLPMGEPIGPFVFYPPFPAPKITPISPSCKDSTDASVRLDFSTDSVSRYDFSIFKLVKKSNASDPCTVSPSAGNVDSPSDPMYCFDGRGASISGTSSNSTILINDSVLGNSKYFGSGLKNQFGAGDYELYIELKAKYGISCVFDTIFNIPDAPELILKSANAKNNYISWDDASFQIRGYGATDTIAIELSGGHPPYRYSLNNGTAYSDTIRDTTNNYTDVAAGSYTVRVTDAHDCKAQGNKTIPIVMSQPDSITISGLVVDSVSCHSNNLGNDGRHSDGNIQFSVKGGIGPYNITVENEPYLGTSDNEGDVLLPGFAAKSYKVTVNDKYISARDSTITVPSHKQLQFNPIPDSKKYWPPCIGGNNGSLKVSGNGGKPFADNPYKFGVIGVTDTTWADKDSIIDLEALVSYKIVVKDRLSCHAVQNITIPQNPNPLKIVLVDTIPPVCNTYDNGKASFTGINGLPFAKGYNFSLTNVVNPEDNQEKTAVTAQFDGLIKGKYEITIKDSNDCAINNYYRDTIFISEPEQIVIKDSVRQVSRKGLHNGYIQATFSGGNKKYWVEWYRGLPALNDSLIKADTTSNVTFIDNIGVGDYLLRVADTCGCNNGEGKGAWLEWETHISEPTQDLGFTVTEYKNVTCKGLSNGRLIIEGKGGWGNNYRYGLQQDKMNYDGEFNNLPAGLYTIYVADESNELFHDTVRVKEPDILSASIASITEPKCYKGNDGSFNLTVTGGTQPYYVSADNSATINRGTGLNGLSANSYNILVSDTFLCNTSIDVVITQPDSLVVNLAQLSNTSCGNSTGTLVVNCSGGTPNYTYKWQNSVGKDYGTSATLKDLPVGAYRLSFSDANGCNNLSQWYTISASDGPIASDTLITPVSCFGYSDGKAQISIEKGIAPYSYKWSTGSETDSATGLQSGNYFVTITDKLNCPNTLAIYIPTPEILSVETLSAVNPQCHDYSNGSITINGQGGIAPYNYGWNNGLAGGSINDLKAGYYAVTVTDANRCQTTHSVELDNPAPVIVDLGGQTTICTGQVVTLDAGIFSGYLWTSDNEFSSNDQKVNLKEQGNYYLKVIDPNGCIATDTFKIITSNTLLNADFIIKSEAYTGDTVVAVDISWPLPETIYWEYDSENISHFSEKDYENLIFNKAGTYIITMYATLGECKDNYSHEIIIKQSSNLKSQAADAQETLIQKFQVSPNPNTGRFKVEIGLREIVPVHLRLFNNSRLINLRKIEETTEHSIEYDIPGLSPGIYILQLIAGKEQKQLKIIIY